MIWALAALSAALVLVFFLGYRAFRAVFCREGRLPLESLISRGNPDEGAPWRGFESVIAAGEAWIYTRAREDVWITSMDGLKLHAHFIPAEGARRTVICAHGYRGLAFRDFSAAAKDLHERRCNLLLIDERAHGMSEGKYITLGVRERFDLRGWARHVEMHMGTAHPVYLDGISMGGAAVLMALDTALPPNVVGIISDCGYTSPRAVLEHIIRRRMGLPLFPVLPLISLYCRLILHMRLDACSAKAAAARASLPALFAHGDQDAFVPLAMGRENYDAYAGEKDMLVARGAGHAMSYILDREAYLKKLDALFEKAEGAKIDRQGA